MKTQTALTTDTSFVDGAEIKHHMRDLRLDRILNSKPRSSSTKRSARFMAAFHKKTGWLWADAVSESQDCANDTRTPFERMLERVEAMDVCV